MAKRSYTEIEKIGTMLLALQEGVHVAAERGGMPEKTVYTWFYHAGGLKQIREFSLEATGEAILRAKRAFFDEVQRVLGDKQVTPAQLIESFVQVLGQEAEANTPQAAAAQAGAQATLQVVIQGTGEVIEVPREQG